MMFSDNLRKSVYQLVKAATGSGYTDKYRELVNTQFFSERENKIAQTRLLMEFTENAYGALPYYHSRMANAGMDLNTFQNPERFFREFQEIAPLTRLELQDDCLQLIDSRQLGNGKVHKMFSSGTSGSSVNVYMNQNSWDWFLAQIRLNYQWMGLQLGMPYLYYWGSPNDLSYVGKNWLKSFWMEGIQNQKVMNCRSLNPQRMGQQIAEMNQLTQYQHMVAYTTELYDLACFALDNDLPVTRSFQGISVTTARLTESMRATMERVFHGPVYARYGCRELGDLGCECEMKQGYHLNPFFSYLEVVDEHNRVLPPGEEGRILVTNLRNPYMPLIRYEIGDLGIMAEPKTCACGRAWKTLEQITGREHERLVLPDGTTVGNVFLNYALEEMQDIRHLQYHQWKNDVLEVQFVSSIDDYVRKRPEIIANTQQRLVDLTHSQLKIVLRQVEHVEKAPSGKQQKFVLHEEGYCPPSPVLTLVGPF